MVISGIKRHPKPMPWPIEQPIEQRQDNDAGIEVSQN